MCRISDSLDALFKAQEDIMGDDMDQVVPYNEGLELAAKIMEVIGFPLKPSESDPSWAEGYNQACQEGAAEIRSRKHEG